MQVTLIAKTQRIDGAPVATLMEQAGRVCTRTDMGDTGKFIKARLKQGHETILEFVDYTFLITGLSRACANQLVRHRIASYAQESLRYCEGQPEFVYPETLNTEQWALMESLYHQAFQGYLLLLDRGLKPEDARYVLPLGITTAIMVKMNVRTWRQFLKLRTDRAAQAEMRSLALQIQSILEQELPEVFLTETKNNL